MKKKDFKDICLGLIESYDLTVGDQSPLNPLAKDVVKGYFIGINKIKKELLNEKL